MREKSQILWWENFVSVVRKLGQVCLNGQVHSSSGSVYSPLNSAGHNHKYFKNVEEGAHVLESTALEQ